MLIARRRLILFSASLAAVPRVRARPLFDGVSGRGWKVYRGDGFPSEGWEVSQGCLHALPFEMAPCIATEEWFEDFDLSFEWKISPGGNAGVFYSNRGAEMRPAPGEKPERRFFRVHSSRGLEYQILDDERAAEAVEVTKRAAALYGKVAAAADKPLRKAGEWNQGRIVVDGLKVEHYLNGMKVVSATVKPEEKFRSPIVLQHHHTEAWFRGFELR